MPLNGEKRIDKLLSKISVKYKNNQFIADRIFPTLPVINNTGRYREYVKNFRAEETVRANGAVAREANFHCTFSSYSLERHSLKKGISDQDKREYDVANLRSDMVEFLTDKIDLRKEKAVAELLTTTAWTNSLSLAAASVWTDAGTTTANPLSHVATACAAILTGSGEIANSMVLPIDGMKGLKLHPSIVERIKYTNVTVSEQILGALFDIPNILIGSVQLDASQEGVTASIDNIYTDVAFVYHRPATVGPLKVSAGYVLEINHPRVKTWRDEERESDIIEVNREYQVKQIADLAGYIIKDIV